ncbi:hypothetical protein [Streptomyces yangpuensis]|uniref:hypothetical protein n=1 Tax=Streptomyces yangpuensis TaxID=1648182 RepID=UPI00069A58C4|nr:hypothetical protein [Streptomyces yangpuensis]
MRHRRTALIRPRPGCSGRRFPPAGIRALPDTDADHGATRQWRALAESKLPELDRFIRQTQMLRDAVAGCLACGCMNFDTCGLPAEGGPGS